MKVSANDVLRFFIEIAVIASVFVWGLDVGEGVAGILIGLAAAVLVAVVWSRFVNPNGAAVLRDPARLVAEVAIFGAGVAALVAIGDEIGGLILAVAALVHVAFTFVLDERDPDTRVERRAVRGSQP